MSKFLDAAMAGDEKAMEAFLADIAPDVRKMITRTIVGYDDVEAIKQDVLIRVWRYLKDFQRGSSLDTWLYRIVVNSINTYLSDKKEDKFISFDELSDEILESDPFVSHESPEDHMMFAQDEEEKARAILSIMNKAGLSAMQHKAMYLNLFQDLTLDEMGMVMNCKTGSVQDALYKATQKMAIYKDEIHELRTVRG